MSSRINSVRRLGQLSCLGLAASLFAVACGDAGGFDEQENLGTSQEEVVVMRRVRLQLFKVEAGYVAGSMTAFVKNANTIFAPANIQFDFDESKDLFPNPGLANCESATLDAHGETIRGKVAVFYCKSRMGGEASFTSNRVMIGDGDNLAHELGHYLGLSHIFGHNFVPQDRDLTATQIQNGFHSAESCIRPLLDGKAIPAHCPSGAATGAAMRDLIFDGDRLPDTGLSVHEITTAQVPSACNANFTLPLAVRRANGTVVNFDFAPVRNNPMGYFGCPNLPLVFSAGQIATMRSWLLTGKRAHLIANPLSVWSASFADASGWNEAKYYSTIRLADVSNDGRADVCGRGASGIKCGVSTGSAFGTPSTWDNSFSDANGWNAVQYYSTIRFPNVSGAGGKDVCGRGTTGVFCGVSTGSAFGAASNWAAAYSDANGWNQEKYYATLEFPEVSGDTKADVCGRGDSGIVCSVSSGTAFGGPSTWSAAFSDANGWGAPQYYKTIKYPNVNGTGGSDVCGRGGSGVYCAVSTGSGFGNATLWASEFSDAAGWTDAKYYSTLAFPDLNNDGKADVCGRGAGGLFCGISNGTSFTNVRLWSDNFGDGDGWTTADHYTTITYQDLDSDGKADVCGRGTTGLYCAYSNGNGFEQAHLFNLGVSDANGWTDPSYYKTLMFGNVDSDAAPELCARGVNGFLCQ